MRIGIVCPYSFDAPGGVQFHIRDLTEELISRGHEVSVLAPATGDSLPDWLVSTGGSVPIKFNGSVARLSFGPSAASRTRRWLEEGNFDVLHIHEPGSPSLGLLALMNADVPVVGTFHAALDHSVIRQLTAGILQPYLERISARIAVSAEARRTLVDHHAGDAVIIPNGVNVADFATATPLPKWEGTPERPVIVFLGRLDEPRKGLSVYLAAAEQVLAKNPAARFLVAGRGESAELSRLVENHPESFEQLGGVSDEEKESLLAGATLYVAPQRGGESFGIVLVEAMSAGTTVIASDLVAFKAVLEDGDAGVLFENGNAADLAAKIEELLADPEENARIAAAGQRAAQQYDWGTVTEQILAVYQEVIPPAKPPQTGTVYEYLSRKLRRD